MAVSKKTILLYIAIGAIAFFYLGRYQVRKGDVQENQQSTMMQVQLGGFQSLQDGSQALTHISPTILNQPGTHILSNGQAFGHPITD